MSDPKARLYLKYAFCDLVEGLPDEWTFAIYSGTAANGWRTGAFRVVATSPDYRQNIGREDPTLQGAVNAVLESIKKGERQ